VTDLLEMLAEMDAPPLLAPWEATLDIYPAGEYERSLDAWVREHGSFGAAFRYPGWRVEWYSSLGDGGRGHTHYLISTYAAAATSAQAQRTRRVRSICDACGWGSPVSLSEHAAVAAWHDHAWPGWRDLPVVPLAVAPRGGGMSARGAIDKKAAARARAWVADHYPTEWQVDRAPVITERMYPGTRDVPDYSPWGGFDIWAGTREVAA